jgi:hypothetical protein
MNNNMQDDDMRASDPEAVSSHARRLAEQGLHEQAQGHDAEADRLLSQALSIDPGAVDAILQQHDAARSRCSGSGNVQPGCRSHSTALLIGDPEERATAPVRNVDQVARFGMGTMPPDLLLTTRQNHRGRPVLPSRGGMPKTPTGIRS